MAVAHDAATALGAAFATTPDPYTFTHTPVGTPRGILLLVAHANTATDDFVSATYGGVPMTEVTGSKATDTVTQPGLVKAFFLGSGIPTGAQTVSIDHLASNINHWAVCISVTAAADTEISGTPVLLQEDGTLAEQNVGTGTGTAMRYAMLYTGMATLPGVGASSTSLGSLDIGTTGFVCARETTAGAGSRPVGFSTGTTDSRAAVHLSVAEVSGGGPNTKRSYAGVMG